MVPEDSIVVYAGVEDLLEQERARLLFSSVFGVGKSGKYITGLHGESINASLPDAVCMHKTTLSVFNCLLLSIFLLSRSTCQQSACGACLCGYD